MKPFRSVLAISPPRFFQPLSRAERNRFAEEGFLILPGFLTEGLVEQVNAGLDRAWTDRSIYNPVTISAFTNSSAYTETYLRNVDRAARNQNYKVNHLYLYDGFVRSLLLGDRVHDIAAQLLEGEPLLFNSLNMEWGSEQRYHFDTLYMPPPVADRMVVFWFALEDVRPGSGALQYYPGSHRIPPYRFSHGHIWAIQEEMEQFDRYIEAEIDRRGLTPVQFHPKRGDAFIWHAQLYHGGAEITDRSLTRRSLVAHYWRAQDVPAEQLWEAAPNRYVLDPRWMCVASNFRSGD